MVQSRRAGTQEEGRVQRGGATGGKREAQSGEYRGLKIADVVVNMEVDGPSHDSFKSQRHCRTRDWRMRRQGVLVERWKVQVLDKRGETESLLIELVQRIAQ
jgi:hypothetical protein